MPAPHATLTSPGNVQAPPPQPPVQALPAKRIPRGMRVVSIRPSEGGDGLNAGDIVDVVSIAIRPEPIAKTLLTGVKVFSVNSNAHPFSPNNGNSVSLLVNQSDVEALALHAELGKILLIPGADDAVAKEESLSRSAAATAMQTRDSAGGVVQPRGKSAVPHWRGRVGWKTHARNR